MIKIYHNPNCSKSRGAVAILQATDEEFHIIEYLKTPPSEDELKTILDLLLDPPDKLVRRDKWFKQLALNENDYKTKDQIVELLVNQPRLMERPVAIKGSKAIIARPSERIEELL